MGNPANSSLKSLCTEIIIWISYVAACYCACIHCKNSSVFWEVCYKPIMATSGLLKNCPILGISDIPKLPILATIQLLTTLEQQKVATFGNFSSAHDCNIWQFLSIPSIAKSGNFCFALNNHKVILKATNSGNKWISSFIKSNKPINCGIWLAKNGNFWSSKYQSWQSICLIEISKNSNIW